MFLLQVKQSETQRGPTTPMLWEALLSASPHTPTKYSSDM